MWLYSKEDSALPHFDEAALILQQIEPAKT